MAIDNLFSRCQDINKMIKIQGRKKEVKKENDENVKKNFSQEKNIEDNLFEVDSSC